MKSCNSLGSRSLELEPGAWFWFWDEPLGGKHVLGFYSLSLSFWYQTILTADSNSLLWVGFKDRVEADLWASVIRWVSRRIAMLSASLISLGLASLNRRRMSGSGRASMNCSIFTTLWSVVGYSCRVNFRLSSSGMVSLFHFTLVLSWARNSSGLSTNPKRRFYMSTKDL